MLSKAGKHWQYFTKCCWKAWLFICIKQEVAVEEVEWCQYSGEGSLCWLEGADVTISGPFYDYL